MGHAWGVCGTLTSGTTASIHIREAVAGGTGFLWEINGTDGTLRITADGEHRQILPLTVAGARGRNEPAQLAAPAGFTEIWHAVDTQQDATHYQVGSGVCAL